MQTIQIPETGTAAAWRDAARACLAKNIPPEEIVWRYGDAAPDLFSEDPSATRRTHPTIVPSSFVNLAESVVWNRDPERFALLYAVLWRLRNRPGLMSDQGDPALSRLRAMEKAVRRCQHKMKAFVRFREISPTEAKRRSFAAWFEPTHFTVEPTAPFFARRFGDMDWRIVTPDRSAIFSDGVLTFGAGHPKPPMPEDAAEALWATYFQNIFNPARVKVKAMQAEMPQKYWRNLPETRLIPDLIAKADSRAREMRNAPPTLPPSRTAKIVDHATAAQPAPLPQDSLEALHDAARTCTRCPLYRNATQVVMGEGPTEADLMFVGEQPGDHEDLAGRPFVGPAGRLFDEACRAVGIDRSIVFVTNAVKHFKFAPRGKRRLHKRPNAGEISHCKWWLETERRLVRPRLIVALGATAAEALTGSGKGILERRGRIERTGDGAQVLLTVHPSYLLRVPDPRRKATEIERFNRDLKIALAYSRERCAD